MNSKLALFDQTLIASLLQPLSLTPHDFKAYRTRVNLKITEQRNEASGEKELKFEISRSDDFEFLFAEILNNDKYQMLARDHDLTVDFDTFPKMIIQHLLCKNIVNSDDEEGRRHGALHSIIDGKPAEITITIILDAEKSSCAFELYSKTPISKGKIFSLKLAAVRGDHLISHLLKICSTQSAKLSNFQKCTDELGNLKARYAEAEKENGKLSNFETKFKDLSEKFAELEDELELVKEERETIRVLAEEKDVKIADLEEDVENQARMVEETKEELDIVAGMLREEQAKVDELQKKSTIQLKEMSRLRAENSSLARNLEKVGSLQGQQSVDMRKLRELEADLKQKDQMVVSLTDTISGLRKELEEERLKLAEMGDSFERLKAENEAGKEKLALYRNNRIAGFSPAVPAPTLTASRNSYRNVLGLTAMNTPHTPLGAPDFDKSSPYRPDSTARFHNPTTPFALRNLSNQTADNTNGSSMTNTPPVRRNE